MVDKFKFNYYKNKNNLTNQDLANSLGISVQALYYKINNNKLNDKDIEILSRELKITNADELVSIFFKNFVAS